MPFEPANLTKKTFAPSRHIDAKGRFTLCNKGVAIIEWWFSIFFVHLHDYGLI